MLPLHFFLITFQDLFVDVVLVDFEDKISYLMGIVLLIRLKMVYYYYTIVLLLSKSARSDIFRSKRTRNIRNTYNIPLVSI